MVEFNDKSRPRSKEGKGKSKFLWSINALYEFLQLTLNAFKSGLFPIKAIDSEERKILPSKQMHQRLPIALSQVKAGSTSENVLNEIRQIIYSLYQQKEITKKVYNNIMNSIKV